MFRKLGHIQYLEKKSPQIRKCLRVYRIIFEENSMKCFGKFRTNVSSIPQIKIKF